ncbi:cupin domain-containing protein [Neolewinella antarctica]|uniref:Uncharacterized protein n=1 Tax=Neolewinella antarctica TaxID=442734 RepID=A0ABX0XCI4_9BACT|nr:hypothetical protein [Neolewinella antarctica]NJC26970.1 hypothetical protein [Neolewinella antarctica]
MMNNIVTLQPSSISSVMLRMKTARGLVTEIMHKTDHSKVIVIGLNADVMMRDHVSRVPAKLLVLSGSVMYRDADKSVPLFQYDELTIPIDVLHSLRGIRRGVCLLLMGGDHVYLAS